MKSSDEIKKGLECCTDISGSMCPFCPYAENGYVSDTCREEMTADAFALIQQLEAQVPKWISVEERLPEGEGWVLAIGLLLKKKHKGDYGWCVPHVAEYRHGRWCDSDGMLPDLEERSLKITHWMPLPSTEGLHDN